MLWMRPLSVLAVVVVAQRALEREAAGMLIGAVPITAQARSQQQRVRTSVALSDSTKPAC